MARKTDYEALRLDIAKIINPDAYWGDPETNHEQEDAFIKTDKILELLNVKDIEIAFIDDAFTRVKNERHLRHEQGVEDESSGVALERLEDLQKTKIDKLEENFWHTSIPVEDLDSNRLVVRQVLEFVFLDRYESDRNIP